MVMYKVHSIHIKFPRNHSYYFKGRTSQIFFKHDFLQNRANFAAQAEIHNNASYQVLESSTMAVLNFHSGLMLALFCLAKKIARY